MDPVHMACMPRRQDRRWDDPMALERELYLFFALRDLEEEPANLNAARQRRCERISVPFDVWCEQINPPIAIE